MFKERWFLSKFWDSARIAQLVERVAFNHNVQGSSPCPGGRFVIFCFSIYSSFRFEERKELPFCYCNSYVTNRQNVFVKEQQARIAQSVECVTCNYKAQGSSPCSGDCSYFLLYLKRQKNSFPVYQIITNLLPLL